LENDIVTSITLCVFFPKGGTGKSLTSWALASYFARDVATTLAIDVDSQSSLSSALLSEIAPDATTYELLRKTSSLERIVVPAVPAYPSRLFVAPAGPKLSGLETESAAAIDRPYMVADALEGAVGYPIRVIDSPPAPGIQATAALVAATHVITPVATDAASWQQLQAFEILLAAVRHRLNPKLNWIGIVPTLYDPRRSLDNEVMADLRKQHGDLVMRPIRNRISLREAMLQERPPWTTPTTDYEDLFTNLIRRLGIEKNIAAPARQPKATTR